MMKITHKLLSLLLVLTLCFSSFVFTASAADDDYHIDEDVELFTPTAHYTTVTESNVNSVLNGLLADASGNENSGFGPSALYGGKDVDAVLVESDYCDDYLMITPTKTAAKNGKVTNHVQINAYIQQTFKHDASASQYYMFELDVATESGLLPMFYQIVARNADGVKDANGSVIDAWSESWLPSSTLNSLYMTMTPGVFHHLTLIGDVQNNVMYIYMDNQLVLAKTNGVTSSAFHSAYINEGASMRIDGMRIQLNNGLAVNGNMSYCIKDMYNALLTGDEAGNLEECLGLPTLASWTGNRYNGHENEVLPPLMTVNGVDYNNTKDASNALKSYKEDNEAELRRSVYSGEIVVDTVATIHTYTAEVTLTAGEHATLTKSDDSTWISTLHSDKYSATFVERHRSKDYLNELKYDLDGNIITAISVDHANAGETYEDTVNADIMQSDNGNKYLYVYDNSENDFLEGIHFQLNARLNENDAILSGHEFFVFDFDIYSESEFIQAYTGFIPRDIVSYNPLSSNHAWIDDNPEDNLHNLQLEVGTWNHLTFVGEVEGENPGTAYVYLNNKLILTIKNGLYTPSTTSSGKAIDSAGNEYDLSQVAISSLRAIQISSENKSGKTLNTNMSLAVDNFDARFVDGDTSLVAGMEDLSGWITNLYGSGYQFPELPAIATIDGEDYYDVPSINEALVFDANNSAAKNVTFHRTFVSTVTVSCNAVINTKGQNLNIEIGNLCSSIQNGNIITVSAASSLDAIYTAADWTNAIRPVSDGNLVTGVSLASQIATSAGMSGVTQGYTGANSLTGDKYFVQSPLGDTAAANTFYHWDINNTITVDNTANQYYTIDFDYNHLAGTGDFRIYTICYVNGTRTFGTSIYFKELIPYDDFAHVTLVFSVNDGKAYVFVNNTLTQTVNGGIHSTTPENGSDFQFAQARIGHNTTDTVAYANLYASFKSDAALTTAITSGSLSSWEGRVYNDEYTVPSYDDDATIATLNGKDYSSAAELQTALNSLSDVKLDFYQAWLGTLTITGDAVIDTNNHAVELVLANGGTKTQDGDIITVDQFMENTSEANSSSTADLYAALNAAGVDGNIFGSIKYTNYNADTKRGSYIYHNYDNGSVMIHDKPYENGTVASDANTYFDLHAKNTTQPYTVGIGQYIILDFDLALESYDKFQFTITTRGSGDSGKWATADNLSKYMKNAGVELYEFAHVTLVGSIDENIMYVFINNALIGQVAKGVSNQASVVDGDYYNGMRFVQNDSVPFYFDNLAIRLLSDTNMADAISASDLSVFTKNLYSEGYTLPTLATLATVDGVPYYSEDELRTVLSFANDSDIEFFHAPNTPIVIAGNATIKDNGITGAYEAANKYTTVTDPETGIVTLGKDTRLGSIIIKINGTTVVDDAVPYGTNIPEYLIRYGLVGSVFAAGGQIWTDVQWSNAPTGYVASAAVTFSGTANTTVNSDYLLLDESGNIVNDGTDIMTFFNTRNGTIVLGNDWLISTGNNQITTASGSINVCLNGYTIRQGGFSAAHGWRIETGTQTVDVNFWGPGQIDFTSDTKGNAIIYTAYNYTGQLTFNGVDIDTTYSIAHLRSGSALVKNCDVDALLIDAKSAGIFMLGEDYNTGYSRNPINLTISDSDITHRLYSYSDVAMIVHRVVSADGATDPKTTVIINNSHIVTEASLVEAYQGHKTPDGGVDTNAASKSNMKVFLNGTTIIAKSLASGEIKEGSIIFYEDVKTNLESTDNISFVITLSKVNTDDGLAPYMYTSHDYATVTWSDGVTELWAGGSLPVHETCKFDSISFVEAGKHYDFSNTMSSAPFGFYANLTLSNSIEFNLYVPETYAGAEVYIDGNLIEAGSEITYVGVAGKMCYNYTIALAPHLSAKEFHILIILPDGKQMSRVASVGAYAVSLFNRINGKTDAASLKDMALLKVVIAYIRAASAYSGFTTDMNLIEVVRSKVGTAQTTAPTGTQYDTSALTAYFTGAQINLLENCRYRFNVKSGADVSGIRFVVNGEEKEAIKAADGSYIELELSAYDMCADIEIYLADAATPIAYYNLYTYYVGLYSISTGSASGAQREATKALELIKSIYTYATVANEYLNH